MDDLYDEFMDILTFSPDKIEEVILFYNIEWGDTLTYKLKGEIESIKFDINLCYDDFLYDIVNSTGRVFAYDGGWRWVPV